MKTEHLVDSKEQEGAIIQTLTLKIQTSEEKTQAVIRNVELALRNLQHENESQRKTMEELRQTIKAWKTLQAGFLDLPREIRDMIYDDIIELTIADKGPGFGKILEAQMCLVSKQVHTEFLYQACPRARLYFMSKFNFNTNTIDPETRPWGLRHSCHSGVIPTRFLKAMKVCALTINTPFEKRQWSPELMDRNLRKLAQHPLVAERLQSVAVQLNKWDGKKNYYQLEREISVDGTGAWERSDWNGKFASLGPLYDGAWDDDKKLHFGYLAKK